MNAEYRWHTTDELRAIGPTFTSVIAAKEWRYSVCSKRAHVALFKRVGKKAWEEVI